MGVVYHKITYQVLIAGGPVPNVIGVDTSAGVSQINAQAVVHLTSRPGSAVEGATCEIWAGYDGHTDIVFKGELDGTSWEYFPGVVSLPARDLLARTRYDWGGDDRTYTSEDDAAIIQNLVEAMGIPSSQTHIESSSWTMGVVEPVTAPAGRAFWPLIEEIDRLAGFRTYTDRAGVIRRYSVSGNVGVGSAFSYAEGDNIIKVTRRRTLDGIVNKCIVTGITYEGLSVGGPGVGEAFADNPFVPDPPRYITLAIQSNLVEDDAKALEIATRMVADKNVRPETLELEVPGEATIQPLSILSVAHSDIEISSGRLIVDRVQHSIRGASWRTTITTLGGNVNATATNIPPVAAFDLKLFREGEDTGSGVNAVVTGIADGSASTDPDGTVAAYSWTGSVDAGTITPASSSAAVYRFAITGAATSVTVSLTVTDAGGATNTLSRTISLTSSSVLVEPLYTAEDGLLAASADGEQTWATFSVASGQTCLAPFAADWGEVWGAANGHIWASIDKLATPAVDLGAPHGAVAVTAVWINETDTTRLWAGFNDGKVYAGTFNPVAVTATWVLAGTIPDSPVHELRESVGALGDLRATAGAGYYHSGDGGASWTLLHTFNVAWRMAAGFGLNLASGLNSTPPLFGEEGTAPTVAGGATHIRGLSFGWRTQELYATDDAAQLYLSDATFTPLALQTDALPAQGNHMVRSGNVDRVVYAACGDGTGTNNGAVKWFPSVKSPWYIRKTGSRRVNMIGYGPAGPPFAPLAVLLTTVGASGADDKLWQYTPGVGWAGITYPQTGWYWWGVAANPFNRNQWLLWGNDANDTGAYSISGGDLATKNATGSPLYYTSDAGATWHAVTLITTSTPTGAEGTFWVAWSDTASGTWCAAIVLDTSVKLGTFWRTTAGTTSLSYTGRVKPSGSDFQEELLGMTPGLAGDFVFNIRYRSSVFVPTQWAISYVPAGAGGLGPLTTMSDIFANFDRFPTTAQLAGFENTLNADDGAYCSDYRGSGSTNQPSALAAIGHRVSVATDAAFVGLRSGGVAQVTDWPGEFSGPTITVVPLTASDNIGTVRVGRAQRLNVAARIQNSADCYIRSSGLWSRLPGPSVSDPTKINNDAIEVLDGPAGS